VIAGHDQRQGQKEGDRVRLGRGTNLRSSHSTRETGLTSALVEGGMAKHYDEDEERKGKGGPALVKKKL